MTEENNEQDGQENTPSSASSEDAGAQKAVVKHVMAPPPPSHTGRSPFSTIKKDKKTDDEKKTSSSGKWDNNFAADFHLPASILRTKNVMAIAGILLIVGVVIGCMIFGSSGSCPPCQDSAFGVVKNPEMPKKVKRCGIAELWDPCRLLLVNASREETKARDMYATATNLTGIPKYRIDSLNIRYANETIKPGYIAEIVIPANGRE